MNRRGFLGSILAAAAAPAIVRASSLMPIVAPKIIVPSKEIFVPPHDLEDVFKTKLYTGTGVSQTITHSIGYAPSFILIKKSDGSGWQYRKY